MAQLKSTRIFGTIKSFALTQSTSVDTGALVVSGGVGIKKNLNVGGSATIVGAVSGTSFNNLKIISPENSATLKILDSKTLTINNTITLSATNDSKTLNIGNGGTLKSGAFTEATANVSINLSATHNATTVVVNSSNGDNATINGATATTAGVVTTGAQTFAGEKTFTGIVTESSGNDIVDLVDIEDDVEIEYGKAYFRDRDNKVKITNSKNSQSLGIASDTYGIKVGRKTDKKQLPIAIGGWVLAHVDNIYKAGTPLVASKNGILSKSSLFIKVFFPERVIAIFDRVEKEEKWNNITVNKRCWVKIK